MKLGLGLETEGLLKLELGLEKEGRLKVAAGREIEGRERDGWERGGLGEREGRW